MSDGAVRACVLLGFVLFIELLVIVAVICDNVRRIRYAIEKKADR